MLELKDEYTIELVTHNMQQATRHFRVLRMCLAELAPDILLSQLFARRFEYLGCFPHLDQVTRSPAVRDVDPKKCGKIGDARCLLHVVGDEHDRVLVLQLLHEFLDAPCRDRV